VVADFLAQTQLTHNINDNTPPPWLPAMACMNTFQWSYSYDFIHRESQSPILNFNIAGLFFTLLDLHLWPNNTITHNNTYNPRPLRPPLPPLTTFYEHDSTPLAMKLLPKIVFVAKYILRG
jgi:hypothetical protein